jgi:hypothetical protein
MAKLDRRNVRRLVYLIWLIVVITYGKMRV